MKTKLVASPDLLVFEAKLNQVLENLKDRKIIKIKYQPFALVNMSYFTALVMYEERVS